MPIRYLQNLDNNEMKILQLIFIFIAVPTEDIHKCFQSNTSLIKCGSKHPLIRQYITLNSLCKEIGVGKQQRNSVPIEWDVETMRTYLHEIKKESVSWKTMKLVLLGDGRIGKTTLLEKIKSQQGKTSRSVWDTLAFLFPLHWFDW